jgi:MraZ protein
MGAMSRSAETSFLGSHVNKLDAKGRVAVPADYRRALEGDPVKGFFCLPSLKGDFLECGGGDFVSRLKAWIEPLPFYSDERELLEEQLLGQMRALAFDTEGRVVLPEQFRSHARLTDHAHFIGRGESFIIQATPEDLAAVDRRRRAALDVLRRVSNGKGDAQ